MKNRLSLVLLVLVLVHYGASEPRQTNAGGTSESSEKSTSKNAMTSPQGFAFDQLVKFFQKKPEKKQEPASSQLSASGQGKVARNEAATSGVVTDKPGRIDFASKIDTGFVPKIPGRAQRVFQLPVRPPVPVVPPEVTRIRKQVKEIMAIDKDVKSVQLRSVREMQKSQEQSRKVRNILTEIEETKKPKEGEQKKEALAKENLLAQEKLREVHEKTRRDAQMSSELENIPAEAGPGPDKES
jgi:hypothetical protein